MLRWLKLAFLVTCFILYTTQILSEDHDHEENEEHDHEENEENDVHEDHEDHAHEEHYDLKHFEILSIYEFHTLYNTFQFCTSKVTIKDDGMLYELIPLLSSKEEEIEKAITRAIKIYDTNSFAHILDTPNDHSVLILSNDTSTNTNATSKLIYHVDFTNGTMMENGLLCVEKSTSLQESNAYIYAFFAEHGKDEVQVQVKDWNDLILPPIECVVGCSTEEKHEETDELNLNNWQSAIGASMVISLTSLVGIFVLRCKKRRMDAIVEYMTSFAAGCLLGVVAFHLYPEGSAYLSDLEEWVMGACVIGGVAFSMAVEQIVHFLMASCGGYRLSAEQLQHIESEHEEPRDPYRRETIITKTRSRRGSQSTVPIDVPFLGNPPRGMPVNNEQLVGDKGGIAPVVWITVVGDLFHAFTDGVVLAVAFKSCSEEMGWAVTLGVIFHEVPHRLGDFFIFLKGGLSLVKALILNFIASLSSLLGVVVLYGIGDVSNHILGFLLAGGTGALLFISMTQLVPPMLAVPERSTMFVHFLFFIVGCVLIWGSALRHIHCELEEDGNEHNHNH